MSVDFMLLGDLAGEAPIGPVDEVVRRARAIGVDLSGAETTLDGVRLEVALDVQKGKVACVHLTPRGSGDASAAMKKLADAIGAVVFDAQTGRGLGEPEPELPAVAVDYELNLVSNDGTVLGDLANVWQRLARSLGPSVESPHAKGDGWSVHARVHAKQGIAHYVVLTAAWSDARAREALFERLVEASEENGWVPFDKVRNDTIGG